MSMDGKLGAHRRRLDGAIQVTGSYTASDGANALLDGNGIGPDGDDYSAPIQIAGMCNNLSTRFETAVAFRESGETHVLWITGPEAGSLSYNVYGGPGLEQLLAVVSASPTGKPQMYETTVAALTGRWRSSSSTCSRLQKASMTALSKQSPTVPIEGTSPESSARCVNAQDVNCVPWSE
jgi:hypothetical protein